jgi:hypothetical protein
MQDATTCAYGLNERSHRRPGVTTSGDCPAGDESVPLNEAFATPIDAGVAS